MNTSLRYAPCMDCEIAVRLSQLVVEASRALDDANAPGTEHEKKASLLEAEVNRYEHEHECVICCPLVPLP
jgi:hypothetical protein